jgi:hypothetical protein
MHEIIVFAEADQESLREGETQWKFVSIADKDVDFWFGEWNAVVVKSYMGKTEGSDQFEKEG